MGRSGLSKAFSTSSMSLHSPVVFNKTNQASRHGGGVLNGKGGRRFPPGLRLYWSPAEAQHRKGLTHRQRRSSSSRIENERRASLEANSRSPHQRIRTVLPIAGYPVSIKGIPRVRLGKRLNILPFCSHKSVETPIF